MSWRVARSLDQLLAQINAAHPHRSKVSDGSIGDAAHATRDSDHNPWVGPGVVTARDFTHDPAGGLDCEKLARALVASADPRIKYIIWNRRIWSTERAAEGWRPYYGSNGHTAHLHLSVSSSALRYDSTRAWAYPAAGGTRKAVRPVTRTRRITVTAGDTLSALAKRTGVKLAALIAAGGAAGVTATTLPVGTVFTCPTATECTATVPAPAPTVKITPTPAPVLPTVTPTVTPKPAPKPVVVGRFTHEGRTYTVSVTR